MNLVDEFYKRFDEDIRKSLYDEFGMTDWKIYHRIYQSCAQSKRIGRLPAPSKLLYFEKYYTEKEFKAMISLSVSQREKNPTKELVIARKYLVDESEEREKQRAIRRIKNKMAMIESLYL